MPTQRGRSYDSFPAVSLFVGYRGCQEIIGLVPRRLGEDKAARGDEIGQHVELIAQFRVKLTSALIARERTVTVGRHIQRGPGDQHCPRSLGLIQSQQKVCEADNCTRASIAASANRLGKPVVGTMRERIAINNQQPSTRVIAHLFGTQDGQLWPKRGRTPYSRSYGDLTKRPRTKQTPAHVGRGFVEDGLAAQQPG